MGQQNAAHSPDYPPLFVEFSSEISPLRGIRIATTGSGLHKILSSPENRNGLICGPEGIREWRAAGIREFSGFLYLTFPPDSLEKNVHLRPFAELRGQGPGFFVRMMGKLFSALENSASVGEYLDRGALISGAFYDDREYIYLLPPAAAEIIHRETSEQAYLPSGISGEGEVNYLLLRDLLHTLWSEAGEKEPPLPDRKTPFSIHPRLAVPELKQEAAELFTTALVEERPPEVPRMRDFFAGAETSGLLDDLSPLERDERQEKARVVSRKIERRRKRALFKKNHGTKILITAGAAVLLLFFASPFLRKAFEKDITEGLSPEEVITLFYESQNELDHETMQECTLRGAGKDHLNQVTNLFVITRIREGIERKSVFIPAPRWIAAGRPPTGKDNFVFGITDLKIQSLDKQENRSLFEAEYTRWTTLPDESVPDESADSSRDPGSSTLSTLRRIQAFRIVEQIELENTRRGWKIIHINEKSRQLEE